MYEYQVTYDMYHSTFCPPSPFFISGAVPLSEQTEIRYLLYTLDYYVHTYIPPHGLTFHILI